MGRKIQANKKASRFREAVIKYDFENRLSGQSDETRIGFLFEQLLQF